MSAELQVVTHEPAAVVRTEFTREQIEVIKDSVAQGTTDTELAFFMEVCKRTGLDPFARQVFAVKRWDGRAKREVMAIQTSIDGYRLIAQRSGEYEGQQGPFWCGPDGVWREVWADDAPPLAAKVGVWRRGFREPIVGIAHWDQYVQTDRNGNPSPMWARMGPHMLAKCAEALGLRRAFSAETAGLYTREEMSQADVLDVPEADDPAEHRDLLDAIEAAWEATAQELRTAQLDEVLQHAGQSVAWAKAVLTKIQGWTPSDEDGEVIDAEVVDTPETPAAWSMNDRQRGALMALLKEAKVDEPMRRHLVALITEDRTRSTTEITAAEYEALLWIGRSIRDEEALVDYDRDGSLLLNKPDGTLLDAAAVRRLMETRS